jgi:tetratricopeptide (TPR) repeat protein
VLVLFFSLPGSDGAFDSHSKAVLIGIQEYPDDYATQPLKFAKSDARLFNDQIAVKALFASHLLLDRPRVGHFTATWYLTDALANAVSGDTIYIFISLRGMARPGAADGYLGTSNLVHSIPEATAVPVSYLKILIEDSKASRVILFADVCREPQSSPANMINTLLADLGKIPKVSGILASAPGQVSQEKEDLKHGVYGYYLVSSGSHGSINIPALWSALAKPVKDATNGSQRPMQIGKESAPLWRIAFAPRPDDPLVAFPRYSVQLASMYWFPALLALQSGSEGQLRALAEQLRKTDEIRDPETLATRLLDLKPHLSSGEWSVVRELAMTALADQGQKYVSRYGNQDMLPDDPLRVSQDQYRLAADSFHAALRLTPEDKVQRYRDMLTVRQLFCEAGTGVADPRKILDEANAMTTVKIPEIENALGISYLEAQQKNYTQAAEHFRAAKLASPGWLYPRHNLALAYIEQGRYREAEAEYRESIAITPQPYVHYNYGLLLQRLNRSFDARREYEQALAGYDAAVSTLDTRGREWAVQLPSDSELARRRAAVFRRNKAEVLNALGTLVEGQGDSPGALGYYRAAQAQNRALWPASYNLAKLTQRIAEKANKTAVSSEAITLLQECTQVTKDIHPRLLLAQLDLRTGHSEEARKQWLAVHEETPGNVEALTGLAQVDRANKNFSAAVGWLNQAVALEIGNRQALAAPRPGAKRRNRSNTKVMADPALYASLAETYRLAGDVGSCRSAYESAIAAAKGSPHGFRVQLQRRMGSCSNPSLPVLGKPTRGGRE